jgi:hypothetical protein
MAGFTFMNFVHNNPEAHMSLMKEGFDPLGDYCISFRDTLDGKKYMKPPVEGNSWAETQFTFMPACMAEDCDHPKDHVMYDCGGPYSKGGCDRAASMPGPDGMPIQPNSEQDQPCTPKMMFANDDGAPAPPIMADVDATLDAKLAPIAEQGLPNCDSMVYEWWKHDFVEGNGAKVAANLCDLNVDVRDGMAEVLGPMAPLAQPMYNMAEMKRDMILSRDLIDIEAPGYPAKKQCIKDRHKVELLKSTYMVGFDSGGDDEEMKGPSQIPPKIRKNLGPLWDRCDKDIIPRLQELNAENEGKLRGSLICGQRWIGKEFLLLLDSDIMWAGGSAASCFLFMAVKCGFIQALAGIGQVILSVPTAMFFWGILGFKFVSTLQNFMFFIIMGIGSAACFVLFDAYQQERALSKEPDDIVFCRAYRRAVPAITLTSATTMMGFLSASMSNIPGIGAFGGFAAIVVLFDYLFAITLFSATFYYCETSPCVKNLGAKIRSTFGKKPATRQTALSGAEAGKLGAWETFFNGPFFNAQVKYGKIFLAIGLLYSGFCWTLTGVYLRPATEATPFLPETHPIQIFLRAMDKFSSGADGKKDHITFIFGLPDSGDVADYTDEDGYAIDPDDAETLPQVIFASDNTIFEAENVLEILAECDGKPPDMTATQDYDKCEVEIISTKADACAECGVRVMKNCRTGLTCVLQPLRDFLMEQANGTVNWPSGVQLRAALDSEAVFTEEPPQMMGDIVKKWEAIEKSEGYVPGFTGPYGFLQKWLEFQQDIGYGYHDTMTWFDYKKASGWRSEENELRALWIRYNATVGRFLPMTQAQPMYEDWEAHMGAFDSLKPLQVHENWVWLITQMEMVTGVISSTITCCILSWICLFVGTQNWILATMATLTIMTVVGQVTGTLVMMGYGLGIIETLGLSIAVGMAVDYTVHIVNAYNNCLHPDRESRLKHAITLMGISVTNGMITTVLAALFLWLCMIVFFFSFGTFIVLTIMYSWLSALFILTPALLFFGPQDRAGRCGGEASEAKPATSTKGENGPANGQNGHVEGKKPDDVESVDTMVSI